MVLTKFFENSRKIIVKSTVQRISRPNVVDRPAWRSALKEQCGEQAGKFPCCVVGKGNWRTPMVW